MNNDNRSRRREEGELLENYTGASSAGDCTGLIPAGGNHSAEEFDNYKDIYPFAVPKKISEYKDKSNKRQNNKKAPG